ncbi:MAG TPA: GNAT family N-acetyltransferase [Mesorhizobium sp.]
MLARHLGSNQIAGDVLGRIGALEVRLASSGEDVRAAQRLRYDVFRHELGLQAHSAVGQIDADGYDEACDHLIVVDTDFAGKAGRRIVGTYRLLRQDKIHLSGGFYSESEFELSQLAARHPGLRFVELGRSCVLPDYRSKRTIELLWQGIWAYLNRHGIDVMVGCASFRGTVPALHAEALSYLAAHCRASGDWSIRAVGDRYHTMDLMPVEAINPRSALGALPPLIKGYLRVGAKVGDGCVIDREFGTVDVFMVMPVKDIGTRYINYYGGDGQKLVA